MIGYAKAAELTFTGRTLRAPEAFELGLVNHVVPERWAPIPSHAGVVMRSTLTAGLGSDP